MILELLKETKFQTLSGKIRPILNEAGLEGGLREKN
jgi:hypothetical protein